MYPYSDYTTTKILGINVGILTREELNKALLNIIEKKQSGWISYINVHTINLAFKSLWFINFLNNSLLTYCDGEGVRWGAKILGFKIPERICLSDWIFDILKILEQNNKNIFILGTSEKIISDTKLILNRLYPALNIVGTHNGYFNSQENNKIINLINNTNADVLFVAMGMPKQEEWIQINYKQLKPLLIFNAGSCFDFVAGNKRRCPQWMGKIGFEWLFRLIQEPRRLWKRYLIGNPLFFIRIIYYRIHTIFCSAERQKANAAK